MLGSYCLCGLLLECQLLTLGISVKAILDPGALQVQEHPLAVVVTVKAQPPRTIRLCWLTAVQLVTAGGPSKAERDALAALFPGDDGLYIMSQVAHAAAGGHLTWDPQRLDRPYRWGRSSPACQWLLCLSLSNRWCALCAAASNWHLHASIMHVQYCPRQLI